MSTLAGARLEEMADIRSTRKKKIVFLCSSIAAAQIGVSWCTRFAGLHKFLSRCLLLPLYQNTSRQLCQRRVSPQRDRER